MKPKIVLSGVNFTGMGPLTVFREAIASLAETYSHSYDVIALVHRKSLFDIPNVTFMEYPEIKSSWFKRLHFEYYQCRSISETIKPDLWFSMHDITPNVVARVRAVYCHNPSPFYRFSMREALLDWKFGLFTLLYNSLYAINIKSNDFVVVQQDWIRSQFRSRYGVRNVVVAHPSVEHLPMPMSGDARAHSSFPYRFFYPAYPRTFKNMEQALRAARQLEYGGFNQFEVWLTTDGTENPYAAKMAREFSDLSTVRWLGLLPRTEVMQLYGQADCLIFPSKLETWGMPITEFKMTGKPILAVDLPYAHETVGGYQRVAFFQLEDVASLANMMQNAATGANIFAPAHEITPDQPFSRNWEDLWKILLAPRNHSEGKAAKSNYS